MPRKVTQIAFAVKNLRRRAAALVLALVLVLVSGCTGQAWNDPYREGEAAGPVFYSSFSERPKHLDPARSYSANEWAVI